MGTGYLVSAGPGLGAETERTRVSLLAERLHERVVEAAKVLVEPRALGVAHEDVLGRVRPVRPVRLDLCAAASTTRISFAIDVPSAGIRPSPRARTCPPRGPRTRGRARCPRTGAPSSRTCRSRSRGSSSSASPSVPTFLSPPAAVLWRRAHLGRAVDTEEVHARGGEPVAEVVLMHT